MATDGIITMNEQGIMETVNRAACELFGYECGELEGRNVKILMTRHDREHHDEYLRRYQRTRVAHIIGSAREVTGRCKDGREFPLRLAVSEVRLREGIVYTGILHDLSEFHLARKRIEDLNKNLEAKVIERTATLRKRESELREALGKERELNALKSRFLSMASHEFKTPLSTILSSTELIGLYTETDQQAKRDHHLERIKIAVEQLTEVLDDFLSISQVEQGEVKCVLQSVDLCQALTSAVESSQGQLKAGQRVNLDTSKVAQCDVRADPKLLRHVLMNLPSNAGKYSLENQTIEISIERQKARFVVKIRDYGIGIPPEDRGHLFDRFVRGSNVENTKGTGLGLTIVAHYLRLMDGDISFESALGRGTTFTLELPPYQ